MTFRSQINDALMLSARLKGSATPEELNDWAAA